MGRPRGWAATRAGRPPMRSPGRPPVARREHRQRFWAAIAAGLSSEDAGVAAGVSPAVGSRWFREGGGMPSISRTPLSGRYPSFAEREEIALLHAGGCSGREISRRLGRSPSTISRELRRNAATRAGRLDYRASTAQLACRPAWSTAQGGQARRERGAATLRPGTPGRRDHPSGRDAGPRSAGALDRPSSRPSPGSPMGEVVESGADRQPAPARFPR